MGIIELIGTVILGAFVGVLVLGLVVFCIAAFLLECISEYNADPRGCRYQLMFTAILITGIVCAIVGRTYGI